MTPTELGARLEAIGNELQALANEPVGPDHSEDLRMAGMSIVATGQKISGRTVSRAEALVMHELLKANGVPNEWLFRQYLFAGWKDLKASQAELIRIGIKVIAETYRAENKVAS